jgi:hypothetical protein
VEELSLYNGTDEGLPILLAILGYLRFSLPSCAYISLPPTCFKYKILNYREKREL